jgi:cytochrome c-type biogenesis protein CcmE
MKTIRKQRLWLVIFIVVGTALTVGVTLFALRQNINLFFSPYQITQGQVPKDAKIRCAGWVVNGSVKRDSQTLQVSFDIADKLSKVTVSYTGILPDLFREGQGIMVTGRMDEQGVLQADEVLAKHDENYMPPEMKNMMQSESYSITPVNSPSTMSKP